MSDYNPQEIELKQQECWEKLKLAQAEDLSLKPKLYLLVEFPYPSGAGLHVGHCRSYTAFDVIARKKRMEGVNVLFPMGWDAFGLPTENYAIKTGIHPSIATKQNSEIFKKQEQMLGLSFDWSREINTTDPKYYKWTQWIFLQLFEKGLAYKAKIPINWCLSCKIGLANEEVVEGKCERCGSGVEKREKEQWLIKITEYAERLINDLELVDFPERVKSLQKDWIGRSEGYEIKFLVKELEPLTVFTTRIDTIFGCTYLVVAPEHRLIEQAKAKITNWTEVEQYINEARRKSDRDRQTESKDKTGVKLEGIVAINPANNQEIPIFVADYILAGYGTGAIMAVPAHDQRDWDFAKQHNLKFTEKDVVIVSGFGEVGVEPIEVERRESQRIIERGAFEGVGHLINSAKFNGKGSLRVGGEIGQWLAGNGLAEKKVNYKLRDWVFSRQRYWGEPIPLVYCAKCALRDSSGQGWVAIPEKDLPVELPSVQDYKPTDEGESPLAKVADWVKTKCPKCSGPAKRETDVMPNWAGSNWYFMRYCDPHNEAKIADEKLLSYWLPVDWYNGGMEHTTLHLLYSRFVFKFLWDISAVPKSVGPEPYKRRTSHGMILGEGGIKMSKSKGNVINPEEVVKESGADTLRIYEMFMGPFEQAIAWDNKGVRGVRRFLDRVWKQQEKVKAGAASSQELLRLLHQTIKKVSEDIEVLKFNTAVSALMILTNQLEKTELIAVDVWQKFLIILAPFAPHLAEELWSQNGQASSIFSAPWPKHDPALIQTSTVNIIVQINGKVRAVLEVFSGATEEQVKVLALANDKVKTLLADKTVKKVIFVPDKLISFVY